LLVMLLAPAFSRLLARVGPYRVVAAGFAVSALGHLLEWQAPARHPWVAVVVYLHIAALGGLLLSGFWSALSDLFVPQTARASYGRIGAAGTVGGVLGGLSVARIASSASESSALLLLAALHAACAAGTLLLRPATRPDTMRRQATVASDWGFDRTLLARLPHLKTLGLVVVLGTASAAIADYLLKVRAVEEFGSGPELLEFFAAFYLGVQVAMIAAQLLVGPALRRLGMGRTMSTLPAGVTVTGTLALIYPELPMFLVVRGLESVVRGSLFRSAYELIFVPMAADEKHRSKTLLDVTCDRLGDAVGAGIVQLAVFTGAAYVSAELLVVMIGMSIAHLWVAGRLDALYLRVIERRLRAQPGAEPIVINSETGWTVLNLETVKSDDHPRAVITRTPTNPSDMDPAMRRLADLRSGDRGRVDRALSRLSQPGALELAQVVQLLAWDDMVAQARAVLERTGASHVGLLTDALLDAETDFAIRRRVPRILGGIEDARAVEGLRRGLDDARFEVRYQCSRALRRLHAHHPHLSVDRSKVLAVVERELSVPVAIWQGHRLIDHTEVDTDAEFALRQGQQNLEHLFSLLSLVLPAEPLTVAIRGLGCDDAALRGVAVEYLGTVLPPAIWKRLQDLLEAPAPADQR